MKRLGIHTHKPKTSTVLLGQTGHYAGDVGDVDKLVLTNLKKQTNNDIGIHTHS